MFSLLRTQLSVSLVTAVLLALGGCNGATSRDVPAAAIKHFEAGDHNAAAIELKSFLADQPKSAEGRFRLGKALFALSEYRAAEVELRKALELKYPAREVSPLLAKAMISSGQSAKVIEEFAAINLGDKASDADLRTSVGISHMRSGQRDLALAALEQALAFDPNYSEAKLAKARLVAVSGDVTLAEKLIDEVVATDDKNADAWQAKGDILLYGRRDLASAMDAYGRALSIKPNFVQTHLARIDILMFQADVNGVRKQYEAMLKVAPSHLSTKFVEAQLAYLDTDYSRGRVIMQGLLRILPDNQRLLILDGAINMQLKEYVQAETSFGKAVRADPTVALARKLLAQTHLLMGQSSNALADISLLLDSRTPDPVALSLAAEAHLQAGNLNKADEYFRRAAAVSPGDVGIRTSAALARLARGEAEVAFAELHEVSRSDKGTTADLALISALLRRGDLDAAMKAVVKLEAKQPDKALPAYLAGRIHLTQGAREAARRSLEIAVQRDDSFFPAISGLAQLDVADKDVFGARRRLQAALVKYPKNSEARMALIELRIFEKAPKDEVAKLLGDLILADPVFAPARLKLVELHLANRAPKAAVAAAQDSVTAFPGNVDYLDALGRSQLAASELQQALSTFNKLSAMAPGRTAPLLQIADVQVLQGNTIAAIATLKRAVEMAPTDGEINRRLMALALSSKQPEKAISIARDLQRRQPKNAAGYLFEAEIEATRKNWTGVIAALRTGISNAPAQSTPMAAKLCVAYLAANKPTDAESFATSWMRDHPRDLPFLSQAGDLLLLRSDWGAAEKYFLFLVKLDPNSASALNNIAWLMLRQNKKGAVTYSQRAVVLSPKSLPMLDTHAMALADDGKFDQSIDLAKLNVAKAPEGHGYRLTLAKVYLAAGKPNLARPELEHLSKLGTKFSESAEVVRLLASVSPR